MGNLTCSDFNCPGTFACSNNTCESGYFKSCGDSPNPIEKGYFNCANLECSTKKDQGWKLDYRRFRVYLSDKFNVKKAFYFIGSYIPEHEGLYNSLEKYGYILVFKKTLRVNNITKCNIDVDLVFYVMKEYDKYNKAIIVSGDGDFYCLIDYLRKQSKLLKILVPNRYSYSSLLREFNNDIVFISDLKAKLEHKVK